MIGDLLRAPVVHFGAGSLGRGLVVPVLAANGASVVLADADAALVERLAADRAYTLRIGARSERIVIAAALHINDPALPAVLREARLVTTAVRQPNLPGVAMLLARSWGRESDGARVVVSCENVRHVGVEIARLLGAAGMDMDRVITPDCVVDRVCAARWPLDMAVETENYLEWSVEGDALAGIRLAETAPNVGQRFTRKRYLVNTYADAMGFLGERAGHTMLHEAAADAALLQQVEPLMAALRLLLHARDGFDEAALLAYQNTARARLANTAIDRRLSTVARDLRRKMSPDERFMEPIAALMTRGADVAAAIEVIAAILDDPAADRAATLAAIRHDWRGADWADAVLGRIASAWETRM